MNFAITAPRLVQVGLGGAALYGGYRVASTMIRSAYREDLLGDPTRVVEIDGKTMIYQTREAQGGKLTNFTMGAGAAAAFAGGALLLGNAPAAAGLKSMLRTGGGAALFALGLGAIAGATAMSAQYSGADFEPVR
ncbi:MAG: hypothetical protein JWM86_1773 [Thermoleophilia bacterium]|nr:hypothetical protein [Thermoleophilia bacterium]